MSEVRKLNDVMNINGNDPVGKERNEKFMLDAFFDRLDRRADFLNKLAGIELPEESIPNHEPEKPTIEVMILCSCYIDWMGSAMYWPKKENGFKFTKILMEHGGEEVLSLISPKELYECLARYKKENCKKTAIENLNKFSAKIQKDRKELYSESEVVGLLESTLTEGERSKLQAELWRSTLAFIVYSKIRNLSVHEFGADHVSFSESTYRGASIPTIDFNMLYGCLKRIITAARDFSLEEGKFFGHDTKKQIEGM